MNRSSRQKISKETQSLNDTLEQVDLIDIYRAFHSKAAEYTFFSVYMEHSPGWIAWWPTKLALVNLKKFKSYEASFLTTTPCV